MSDLDKNIGAIIDEIANNANSQGLKGLAFTWGIDYHERIMQAFTDAGWVPAPDIDQIQQANKLVQDMANILAQSKVELNRLMMTPTPTYRLADKLQHEVGGQRLNTHGCIMCQKCNTACPLCKTCKCHKKPLGLGDTDG